MFIHPPARRATSTWLAAVTLALGLGLGAALVAAAADAPSQCVVCHLDAAKLKALTPPDPPAGEAGEG